MEISARKSMLTMTKSKLMKRKRRTLLTLMAPRKGQVEEALSSVVVTRGQAANLCRIKPTRESQQGLLEATYPRCTVKTL